MSGAGAGNAEKVGHSGSSPGEPIKKTEERLVMARLPDARPPAIPGRIAGARSTSKAPGNTFGDLPEGHIAGLAGGDIAQ